MKIAYISQHFPVLTETFVYREITALRKLGVEIVPLANRTVSRDMLPKEAQPFLDETISVFPLAYFSIFWAHVYFAFRFPRCYLRMWLTLLREPSRSPRIWLRNIAHVVGATLLAYRIRNQGIDHIHAHFSNNSASLAMHIATLLHISFSFTVHNNHFTDRLLLKEKYQRASFMAVISHYSRDALYQMVDVPEPLRKKAHIVRCGVSPYDFSPKPLGDKGEPFTILFASQLAPRKGAAYLVQACKLLVEKGYHFRCIIAGDGIQRMPLEQLVVDCNLQGKITFHGRYFQEEFQDLLQLADVFVLPCCVTSNGDIDGIPVVLMEAMSSQIPVISTTVSGIVELIDDMVSGLLVAQKDAHSLGLAIERLMLDNTLRHQLAVGGREKIIAEFNIDHTAQQLHALFKQSLLNQ
jgi:colanic acid/amylovoran biosynthesis glycosyltransferase